MQEIFEPIIIFVIMGFSVEAIVDTIKQIRKGSAIDVNVILSLFVGQILAFTFRLDLYSAFGIIAFIPYVTMIVTGILISRGGNFVNDLIARFNMKSIVEKKGE